MGFFIDAFNILLYQPLFNFLILLYKFIPDFGMAVIILTILIRFLFYPLGVKAIKSQKAISELQPKIKEIQERYKNDKEKQAREMMELYRKEKINPFSGFLPLLIQLPILIALYRVFWQGLEPEQMNLLYSFIPPVGQIDPTFLEITNLAQPSLFFAVLAGVSQFFQAKFIRTKNQGQGSDFSKIIQKQMQYFFPIFTILILLKLPAAIGLYWITTTFFTIIQQYFIYRKQEI